MRRARPASHACRSSRPASMVLPRPTSSAISSLGGQLSYMRWKARIWCGHGVTAEVASPIRSPPFGMAGAWRMKPRPAAAGPPAAAGAPARASPPPDLSALSAARTSRPEGAEAARRSPGETAAVAPSPPPARRARSRRGTGPPWAKSFSSSSRCARVPVQSVKTWKLSQLCRQPCSVSLMLPLKASRLPALSSMMPAFS